MNENVRLLKTLADENRLRLLLLLGRKELFVCQLMAVTGLSQSLVSRNLALLEREGLLDSRRQGKHVFYRLKINLPLLAVAVLDTLEAQQAGNTSFAFDRLNLELFCRRFQRSGPSCDMSMVKAFMEYNSKNKKRGVNNGKTGQKNFH